MTHKPASARDRIIIALDVDNADAAKKAVTLLKGHVGAFKIGFELFVSEGPDIVRMVMDQGCGVFLDLKFHDIPNTVAKSARAAVRMGVMFFDVHASGGRAMMTSAANAASDEAGRLGRKEPISLAVTVLTSLKESDLRDDLGILRSPEDQVVSLATLAKASGIKGIVASPLEAAAVRAAAGGDFIIVTPGVRPSWAALNDQQRVATPLDAITYGADYIVIGRPVLGAADPVGAAEKVRVELEGAVAARG